MRRNFSIWTFLGGLQRKRLILTSRALLRRSCRGVVSIEAAIVTPAFILTIITSMQLMVLSWHALTLQMATNNAAHDFAVWGGCKQADVGDGTEENNDPDDDDQDQLPDPCVDVDQREIKLKSRFGNGIKVMGLPRVDEVSLSAQVTPNAVQGVCGGALADQPLSGRAGDIVTISAEQDVQILGFIGTKIRATAAAVIEIRSP